MQRYYLTIVFQDHPYNAVTCEDCWQDRVDKLIVWEPPPPMSNASEDAATGSGSVCLCQHGPRQPPLTVVSLSERLTLELRLDQAHAAVSYFKHAAPLFEARYEFVHGPLCGPALLEAATDGELLFPHYEALGHAEPPRSVRCIWELRVNRDRDLWLHFDKVKFASRSCEDGKLELFLPGKLEPIMSVCGENVSVLKDVPILPEADISSDELRSVRIEFSGSVWPARTAFKIAWTELFHLPRNPDGTSAASGLVDDCELRCVQDAGVFCVSKNLVCEGTLKCFNILKGSLSVDLTDTCGRLAQNMALKGMVLGVAFGLFCASLVLVIICRTFCFRKLVVEE